MKFQKNTLAAVILAALLAPAAFAQDTGATGPADTSTDTTASSIDDEFEGGEFTGDWEANDMGLVADGFIAVAEDFAKRDAALAALAADLEEAKDQIKATDTNLTQAIDTRVSKAAYEADKKLIGGAFKEVKDAILTIQNDMDNVDGWLSVLDEDKVDKADYEADKKKIEDTVNPLVEGVNRLAEETLKVKDKANSTAQKVDDLEFTVNGAVESVKAKVDNSVFEETVLKIQDDMDNVDGWLSVLSEDKADKEDLEALMNDVEENAEKIGALSAKDRELTAKTAELDAKKVNKAEYDADKKKIEDTVNPLVEGVNRLAEETLKVKDKANSTAQKVDDLEFTVNGAVEAVKTKADKAELEAKADKTALEAKADKTALEAKADKTALEAKADKTALALKANIADVYSKTQADEKFVTQAQNIAVTQTVARNSQRIANLEGSVASLNTRVNAVEQKLKRGLATQAALSGLFQPYNVGKVNVTAAVGGYQSKSAVAVGMGYRVNEKFAAKAGVAVSLGNSSNTSYHVGVNYEF